jgi:hypothetical protein
MRFQSKGFWCIGALILVLTGCDNADRPRMHVEVLNKPGLRVTITSDDRDHLTVNRLILNDRDGESGCDTTERGLPATLEHGDAVTVYGMACGSKILQADVYTNRGTASFKFR